jgi:hypothetical protein
MDKMATEIGDYRVTDEWLRKQRTKIIVKTFLDLEIPEDQVKYISEARADNYVSLYRQKKTTESWYRIRKRIYNKYNGICQVCHTWIPIREYECGHIVDRVCGGSDLDENLLCMCVLCNRLKPLHESLADFFNWVNRLRRFAGNDKFCLTYLYNLGFKD